MNEDLQDQGSADVNQAASKPMWRSLVRLARPKQWAKSAFVFIGPVYALQDMEAVSWTDVLVKVLLAAAAFSLASSGCYVFNDIADIENDRTHPRKRFRPIASGAISIAQGRIFGSILLILGGACALLVPDASAWVSIFVILHVANVTLYSARLKHIVIVDVMSLSMGFVLRVMAGCLAVGVWPTTWLLNVSLFLSMSLAFGKRLGERRSLGTDEAATAARRVQSAYSDDLLRMLLVVSSVATLFTYASYVVTREDVYKTDGEGFNLLWVTLLPATYGLLRAITLLESGRYDDPTEIATRDRPFQLAALMFGGMTMGLMAMNVWSS